MAQVLIHLPQRFLMALVRGYRLLLKPWLGNACRFEPTCSAYSLQALAQQGAVRGTVLTAGRILRCHPWCQGGFDPVPDHFPNPAAGLFIRLGLKADAQAHEPRPPTRNLP
jgi:putative membrane protein insertion efficiency factor